MNVDIFLFIHCILTLKQLGCTMSKDVSTSQVQCMLFTTVVSYCVGPCHAHCSDCLYTVLVNYGKALVNYGKALVFVLYFTGNCWKQQAKALHNCSNMLWYNSNQAKGLVGKLIQTSPHFLFSSCSPDFCRARAKLDSLLLAVLSCRS